jgi:four helix bundle protein
MAKGDDLEERLIDFAVRIIRVCDALPDSPTGKHVRGQLLRSGTSAAPNYGEARGAESGKDFVHKLKIGLKELNESRIWLKVIIRAEMLPENRLDDLLDECDQLCRIISTSIQTAKQATTNN